MTEAMEPNVPKEQPMAGSPAEATPSVSQAQQPSVPKASPAASAEGGAAKPAAPKAAGASAEGGAAKPAAPKPAAAAAAAKPAPAAAPKAAAKEKEVEAVPEPPKGITRREFLNYVWGASMALFLLQFGGITFLFAMPRFRAGEFGGLITVAASEVPQVNAAPVANNIGKFWLVHTDAGINAIYRVCTHLGCLYFWSEAAGIFACPCHGSQFKLDGAYIAGPAPRDLDRFTFQVLDANGNVLAASTDGQPVPLPPGADRVVVNTGQKILGKSIF
jgi:cytochrome b6-f complex iron-sulfur subunit